MKVRLAFSLVAECLAQSPGTFSVAGNMVTPRFLHTATLLQDGRVLIAGGGPRINGAGCSLASAELYDSATSMFTATAT